MSRIAATFARLRDEGRAGLIPFVEAFDPDRETSATLLAGMAARGADLIEIGMPFTDPMADGPTIQQAGRRALRAGATLAGTLGLVRDFRAVNDTVPLILMGYLNPILSYGVERFTADAAAAGVDGVIVVDLPTEEADLLLPHLRQHRIDLIRLVAPTTTDE
ncbi:MAG: tryptophan synthase subunit alpha, partial [Rhodospirillales bacterium]|nr:tryptophan synthase subunit alpha [Rhodospirillales bacterium]